MLPEASFVLSFIIRLNDNTLEELVHLIITAIVFKVLTHHNNSGILQH